MTPEENEANIKEILQTIPGMTREKIAEWDKMGKPMTQEDWDQIAEKQKKLQDQ